MEMLTNIIYKLKTLIFGFQYPKSIDKLHQLFYKKGSGLFIVGGAVRDYKLWVKPKDFDLCTNALTNEIIDILKEGGYRYNEVGAHFGVVIAYTEDGEFEIATFREDITEGRNPQVRTGATMEEDAQRRDLSIGAMYYSLLTKQIHDFSGGLEDIKTKTIRMVGNPVDRIREDKLRILRVGRFFARLDGRIDITTLEAITRNNSLEDVSNERIWDELVKTYKSAKNIDKFYNFCNVTNLWEQMFPAMRLTPHFRPTKNLTVDMALLFSGNKAAKLGDTLTKNFKIPLEVSKAVEFMVDLKDNFNSSDVLAFYKKKERFKVSNSDIKLFLSHGHYTSPELSRFLKYKPTILSENVIKQLGIALDDKGNPRNSEDGKLIGETIKKMESELFELNK